MLYALTRFEFANTTGTDSFSFDGEPVLIGVYDSFEKASAYIEKEPHNFDRVSSSDPYMDEIYGIPFLHLRDSTTSSGKNYTTGVLFYISFLDYIANNTTKVYYMYKDDLVFPMYFDTLQDVEEQIAYYRDKANIKYDKFTSSKKKYREVYYARHNQGYMVVEQITVNQTYVGGL